MQVSGASSPTASSSALPVADLVQLTKIAVAADATQLTEIAASALPDPDPSKGGNVDTYA